MSTNIAFVLGYNVKHSIELAKGKSDEVYAGRLREYEEWLFDTLSF